MTDRVRTTRARGLEPLNVPPEGRVAYVLSRCPELADRIGKDDRIPAAIACELQQILQVVLELASVMEEEVVPSA